MATAPTPSRAAQAFAWGAGVLFVSSLTYFLYSYLLRWGESAPHTSRFEPWTALVIDVLLFSAFALHHSVLARPSVKRAVARVVTPALERTTYVWVASILLAVTCWLWQTVPGALYDHRGLAALPHWLAIGVAFWVVKDAVALLDPLELAGIRQATDSKTPTSSDTTLKSRGPYRLVRHPIYLGWVLFVFGVPHMTLTRLAFATISTLYLILAVPFEERALVSQFGTSYQQYQRLVRWRMIPFVY